jgi:ergothioneine biosynthesis protein EgtB
MAMLKQGRPSLAESVSKYALVERYQQIRRFTEQLCEPLAVEDYVIQSMPDVSPTKWHLAHVSWFWETFLLSAALPDYRSFHPEYAYLFNSYYNTLGQRHCRPKRGLISRPTVKETYAYRHYVDERMLELFEKLDEGKLLQLVPMITLGLHHEQQHQELLLTDIKHVLSCNPLNPVYREYAPVQASNVPPLAWLPFSEDLHWIGHDGQGFAFDNEQPRHREFVHAFQLASRLVTNGEYLAFIEDGGYANPLLWLSEGWATCQEEEWQAPLYWEKREERWWMMTLSGLREVNPSEPVCHISYFEADAFARWSDARLPTEMEWEVAAQTLPLEGNLVESGLYHPQPLQSAGSQEKLAQMYGDVWEWTQSSYAPYPGFRTAAGAVGEYNGKFMCNQYVLRGGSCATALSHLRSTYRNFFPASARWQFMGLRLAREESVC